MSKYLSQKHDFQASANILQNILLVAAAGLRCVLRSYSWRGLLCPPLSPTRTPTFSTSPLKSCFPFFSLPPLLSQFPLVSSFSFSPLPSFSALSSILILICFFSPLHSCISLLLSCPLVPTLSLFPLPAPGNGKLWKARSPGIHQHRLRVFLVMGAQGQGAFALQQVGGSELKPVLPTAAHVLAEAVRGLHGRPRGTHLRGFPSTPIPPGAKVDQDSASLISQATWGGVNGGAALLNVTALVS